MQTQRRQYGMSRHLVVPMMGLAVIGTLAVVNLRGNAGQQAKTPPIQPTAQVLGIQTAFEQVADKLRPSIVFIKSQTKAKIPVNLRQNAPNQDQQEGDSPFGFNFPGFPGGGNGRQFRMIPPRRSDASGSGVIVRNDGYILTNDHVVAGADKVTVTLQDGRELPGTVKRDFRSDLALIKVEANNLPAAELADSDKARIGQWAIAFGSPFGLSDTMTVGVVSSLHRAQAIGAGTEQRYYASLIQTDASINPGNSGGPLVDVYGRVVGINVAIESPSGGNVGIGFAIPANTAKFVMDELIAKGTVTRGYLGLEPHTLTYNDKQKYGLTQGALVKMVNDGTPAAKAGIQVADVIVSYNGKSILDDANLRDLVARTRPGTTVPVVVKRDGGARTLQVTVGTPPDPQQVANNFQPAPPQEDENKSSVAVPKLGLHSANSNDPAVRKLFNRTGEATPGAVVVEVLPGSPAEDAGLQPGDTIVRLNDRSITNAEQLATVARTLKSGASVPAVIRRGNIQVLIQLNLE